MPTGPASSPEVEVLRLVAAWQTNRQAEAELLLSLAHGGRHVDSGFGKLGVASGLNRAAVKAQDAIGAAAEISAQLM